MANTNLNVDMITAEALRILHQKLTFVGSINRGYDDSFAKTGAKIGDTLRIRLPNQFTVRTGATLQVQDVNETNISLQVATQKGIDFSFSSEELTMDIDRFSERYLEPAMSRLAAEIESDVLTNVTKDVYHIVDNGGSALTFKNMLDANVKLKDSLAPNADKFALLSNAHEATLVDALKGLFNDQSRVSEQYREGIMGRTAGMTFMSSSHVADHTTGTSTEGDSGRNINGASQTGSTITIDTTGGLTFLEGDVITLAGVNAVHPETKTDLGVLQRFVVTSDCGASDTSLTISPSITVTGANQNVSASPTNSGAVSKIAAGANGTLNSSLVYHKDAFTLATADLVMPTGVDMASRQVHEGISLRFVRNYDINNDLFPGRFDVLYGYQTLRPEHACRVHADG